MQESSKRIIRIIRRIRPGCVLSYGEVARRAGLPGGARTVARILHCCSGKHDLPWHRVVNAQGRISLPDDAGRLQRRRLLAEGVEFDDSDRIDMARFSRRRR